MSRTSRCPGLGRGTALAVVLLAALSLGMPADDARAHIVYGSQSLHLMTQQSELVARIRVVNPTAPLAPDDANLPETVVVSDVLEVLKGTHAAKTLRFTRHGHGVASYEAGEEVLVFAIPIARSAELADSIVARHVEWVSQQESRDKFVLDDANREATVRAVRAYAGLPKLTASERKQTLRRVTVDLLRSPHAALASSAIRDLVLAPDAPLVMREDLPLLLPVIGDTTRPMGVRVGLLAELERRGLVDAGLLWAALVRDAPATQRIAAIRAAGVHPSAQVNAELLTQLAGDDVQIVAAAALALGSPGNAAAVAPLAKLFGSDAPRVRMAVIRGLGRIATPSALEALAEAAAKHADADTRRRAAAELRVLQGRTRPGPG